MNPKRAVRNAVLAVVKRLPPDRTLRFLFRIEQWLYYLEGQLAIAYGNGVHTKHRHINYHAFFTGRIEAGERVLDIGCHNGAVAHDIATATGAHVVGIEINAERVAAAHKLHPHPNVEYRHGDVLRDLRDESFDVIVLSNVLEHLPDRPDFLRRVQSLTHPSRLLIRVPLFERDWRVPLKRELGVEWRLDPTHEIEYTLETFADEMARAGLRPRYQEVRWGEIWAELVPDGVADAEPDADPDAAERRAVAGAA